MIVGSELTSAAVSPTTPEGKRAVRDAGVMIREAVRMTRKDVWVLEPDGVAKDRRQPLTELNVQVCVCLCVCVCETSKICTPPFHQPSCAEKGGFRPTRAK